MIFSSLSVDRVVGYSTILFAIATSFSLLFCAIYIALAKKNYYKHVNAWIAEHYAAELQLQQQQPSETTNLLFSKGDVNDPLLKV
jgi:hypothetical protein